MDAKGNFPDFKDGDVHIIINGTRQYHLHSHLLCSPSAFFTKALTDDLGPPIKSKAAKKGVVTRWRCELVETRYGDSDCSYVLATVPMNGEGQPVEARSIPLDLENGMEVDPVHEAWDAVLRVMYGQQANLFDTDSSLSFMIAATYRVLDVADYLGVNSWTLTKAIEADFQSRGQSLHRAIARAPAEWISLALRCQSQFLFKEAATHAVGQYHTKGVQAHYLAHTDEPLPKTVLDLITAKYKKLQEGLKLAQMKMLAYYPANLQRSLTVGLADRDNIGRNSYSNDIFGWMALNIFRHFISQNLVNDLTHHDTDMGYEFFKLIAEGGEAYLSPPMFQDFHQMFPMTDKGKTVLYGHLLPTKQHCRQFAAFFMENQTLLDVKSHPSGYFTCAKVDWQDYQAMNQKEDALTGEDSMDD